MNDLATLSPEDKYVQEKDSGRRRASGVLNLSRLRPKHINILKLHLEGLTNLDISRRVGISHLWVSSVLNDPLSLKFLNKYTAGQEQEFHALRGLANDSVRTALRSGVMGHRLRAAKMFYDRADILNEKAGKGPATAEDIAQELIKSVNINVQVNVGESKCLVE